MPPKVSVILPVYNAARHLDEALASVLAQTWTDFELLTIDDGSTDNSGQLLEQHARLDGRVRILQSPHVGITRALNIAGQQAIGEFVARMDADDICLPQRFTRQLDYLAANPQTVAVGCDVLRIDEQGLPIAVGHWPSDHAAIDAGLLRGQGGLPHPAAMIRRSALEQVGWYREQFATAQDKDLWLRLAEIGQLANLDECLLSYREHARSVSAQRQQDQITAVNRAVQDARVRRKLPPDQAEHQRHVRPTSESARRRDWIKAALRAGNGLTAAKHARALLASCPLDPATWSTLVRFARHPQAARLLLTERAPA